MNTGYYINIIIIIIMNAEYDGALCMQNTYMRAFSRTQKRNNINHVGTILHNDDIIITIMA